MKAVAGGTQLAVRLQPRAARTELGGLLGAELKVRVTAPPVEGAANAALVAFLAERLEVPRAAVQIARGRQSGHKLVHVAGLDPGTVARRLRLT